MADSHALPPLQAADTPPEEAGAEGREAGSGIAALPAPAKQAEIRAAATQYATRQSASRFTLPSAPCCAMPMFTTGRRQILISHRLFAGAICIDTLFRHFSPYEVDTAVLRGFFSSRSFSR